MLKANPNVDLISFFILRTFEDLDTVPQNELSLIQFPTRELFEEELGSFDLVVLMNFEYGPYGIGPYLENLRRYVYEGGALAMVGGDQAFSSGHYFGTPLAEALPVELFVPGWMRQSGGASADDPLVSLVAAAGARLFVHAEQTAGKVEQLARS